MLGVIAENGKIFSACEEAYKAGARLRLGPELEIPGYGCADHFHELDTEIHSWEILKKIVDASQKVNNSEKKFCGDQTSSYKYLRSLNSTYRILKKYSDVSRFIQNNLLKFLNMGDVFLPTNLKPR